MRSFVSVLVCILLAAPAVAGSFHDLKGRGEDDSVTLVDEEISRELGTEIAYHLAYTRWVPDTPNGVVIVHAHGLQDHRSWFFQAAAELSSRGYTVYAFDRIGSGTSSPGLDVSKDELVDRRGHVRDWRLLTESLDAMVALVALKHEGAKIAVWGEGWGAKVVTAWLMGPRRAADSRGVTAAIFTSPGLFDSMQRPVSKVTLPFGRSLEPLPVPMLETNGDNGAHWFAGSGAWFDRVRDDELSLREVTRGFYRETQDLDRFIARRPKRELLPVRTFHLLLRGDPMTELAKTEAHVRARASEGLLKVYDAAAPGGAILFSSMREEALRDIDAFLMRGASGIDGASVVRPD